MKIKSTQKATNIANQLPTNCDQGTNNLAQVTNIFKNTRFASVFESLCLDVLLNFSNPQTGAFG